MQTRIAVALLVVALLPLAAWADEEPPSPAEVKAQVTADLLEILGKTRSTDTFMVTLTLLVESKADVRAIPVAIANAERLGIFDDNLTGDDPAKAKLAEEVSKLILQIQKPGNKGSSARYNMPACNQSYAPPVAGSTSNKPYSTPLQPPVAPGGKLSPVAPPTDAEILRALRGAAAHRDNVEIVTEKVIDRLDDPRFYPLVGPAQWRHVHYKCTVHFTEPTGKPRVEVVYIDKDQLHLASAR